MEERVIGAILIGGSGRRMGLDKAAVEVGGRPMVDRVAAALGAAGLEVVTVGSPDRIPGYVNITDPPLLAGPLAGLAGALDYGAGRSVFISAVDQPLLRPETISRIIAITAGEAVVPIDSGFPQVTCALYRAACLPVIGQITADRPDASIRSLVERVDVRFVASSEWAAWGEDGSSWWSVDTPEDVSEIGTALEGK